MGRIFGVGCTLSYSSEGSPDRAVFRPHNLEIVLPNRHAIRTFKFKTKCAKLLLLSEEGCHTRLDGQHCSLRTYHGVLFKGGETLLRYK
jgi:hypothetical protein